MRLRDSIWIRATPAQVFAFFEAMDENYLRWHPDHRLFRWEHGRGVREGVIFYFEEEIGGTRMKKRVHFTRVEPGRHLEFTFTNRVLALIVPRLSFHVTPEADGVRVDAEIRIRTGPLGAWLNRREFDAVRVHMREEGQNLKRLLEREAEVHADR
jgi:uncharacterized protein YndB with AHSA1/START domain